MGNAFVPLADVVVSGAGATLIRPANGERIALVLTNTHATVAIRLGDSGVTATKGVELEPKASVTITARAAIYGISLGADVTVAMSEELRA